MVKPKPEPIRATLGETVPAFQRDTLTEVRPGI
jgi:hypothetical protein